MAYVVTEACIRCKFMDCVEACPVDCFYESELLLVINPEECIDCGACEPECPAEAIKHHKEPGMERWLSFNAEQAARSPQIVQRRPPAPDAEQWIGVENKYQLFFTKDREEA